VKLKVLLFLFIVSPFSSYAADPSNVTRATLSNGLHVVIVRNALAPVVTVELNFKVGGDETPPGFPGSAHAEEHMAFRGCTGVTADQIAAIYAQLGGRVNADTQQNITQYFTTVPASDLDVTLQTQSSCLRGVDNSEAEWAHERDAIEQEVSRDLSNPTYKFIDRLNGDLFAGTPYAHDPLGTRPSFDATTAAALQDFYKKWYTPGNAILVIVGDVDPAATIAKVKQFYGDIPSHPVPEHPAVNLAPVKPESFTLDSNLPYVVGFVAYRMPGTDSPDYAPMQIMADVLASQRADLYGMVPAGKALYAGFGVAETYPKASVGYAELALPAGADATGPINEARQIIEGYAQKGLPQDLFDAAKRSEIASAEFQRNSIPGLASVWSEALTAEGRNSPDDDIQAIRAVTLADVNRVAKQYLVSSNSITATLKPAPSGEAVSAKGFGGEEKMTSAPTKPVVLPAWASGALSQLKVPSDYVVASDTMLPNGLRLIVKSDHTSPTITVVGEVKNNADLQTPKGQEGVSDVLDGLYSYGTQTLDRLAFQKALDDIAANESAGYSFSVQVLKENFSRGVELLADNELHPALPAEAFAVVKDQTTQFVSGNLKSPGYRTSRALDLALLPAGDPDLREATPATLGTVTLADVKQYHATTMRPDLTTIVVIGDVTPVNKSSAANVPDPQAVQDSVVLAQQLNLNRFDPDYYPLQLGNHVLGGGFYATRLYHDLRQVAGYVYNVDVSMEASKTRASYSVTYGCDPDKVSKARALIQRDLDQMRTQDVSPDELHLAKAMLLRSIPLGESSEEGVAQGLLHRAVIGLPLDEPIVAAKKYFELNADQVKAAFARQLRLDDFVQVVRGPAPQ